MRDQLDEIAQQLEIRVCSQYGKDSIHFSVSVGGGNLYEGHPVIGDIFEALETDEAISFRAIAEQYPHFRNILLRLDACMGGKKPQNLKKDRDLSIHFELES